MINGIVLVGPPGAGKSTIGKRLAEINGFTYISSGDIARRIAEYDQDMKDKLDNGGMADEDTMMEEMVKALNGVCKNGDTFILDGFPRHMAQYQVLNRLGMKIIYYYIMCDIGLCINRISDRARDRGDTSTHAVRSRMDYYTNITIPTIYSMMEFNQDFGKIILNDINGISHIDQKCMEISIDMEMRRNREGE